MTVAIPTKMDPKLASILNNFAAMHELPVNEFKEMQIDIKSVLDPFAATKGVISTRISSRSSPLEKQSLKVHSNLPRMTAKLACEFAWMLMKQCMHLLLDVRFKERTREKETEEAIVEDCFLCVNVLENQSSLGEREIEKMLLNIVMKGLDHDMVSRMN